MTDRTIIVYAHPYVESFNHAILAQVENQLTASGHDYTTLDLYRDGFNPVYTVAELGHFAEGVALDPLVKHYQTLVKEAKQLILIFPIWWQSPPAIVKGFFDKVMLKNFAYYETSRGIRSHLGITSCLAITTSQAPTWYLKWCQGNAIQRVLLNTTLKSLGVKRRQWINCGGIKQTSVAQRQQFLTATVGQALQKLVVAP